VTPSPPHDAARTDARARALAGFSRSFGGRPTATVRAPGRVNVIGDHTDHHDGFVLPMAIDRAIWIALRPRDDQRVVLHALDVSESHDFDLASLDAASSVECTGWRAYVTGIARVLTDTRVSLRGWEGTIAGDVPLGAGLSSSAALELATARAFAHASGLAWNATEMARLAQRAEHEWVGVQCGIMDQLIVTRGIAGHALLIDCRTLESTPVPLPSSLAVVVLDTATRRELTESAYNARRAECDRAARALGVRVLRDATPELLAERATELDPIALRRARHVIGENERVQTAARALAAGDLETAGRLARESHASLRDDFEVSRRELDLMVELASADRACYGARLTGAGFGGCAVALVRRDEGAAFAARVADGYARATGLTPSAYVSEAADGASEELSEPL
jgi:galactokinase